MSLGKDIKNLKDNVEVIIQKSSEISDRRYSELSRIDQNRNEYKKNIDQGSFQMNLEKFTSDFKFSKEIFLIICEEIIQLFHEEEAN